MLLRELYTDWTQDNTFTYKLGLIEYQCNVKYLLFSSVNRENYEKKNLINIYTPIFHFEFEALNTEKTIYQSHWVMPYSLVWYLDNYSDISLDKMVCFAAKENGFLDRITAADRKLQRGTQLSIFNLPL